MKRLVCVAGFLAAVALMLGSAVAADLTVKEVMAKAHKGGTCLLVSLGKELNADDGLTVLVVEQNANVALDAAARAYVLEVGQVAIEGQSAELRRHEGVRKSYLGY